MGFGGGGGWLNVNVVLTHDPSGGGLLSGHEQVGVRYTVAARARRARLVVVHGIVNFPVNHVLPHTGGHRDVKRGGNRLHSVASAILQKGGVPILGAIIAGGHGGIVCDFRIIVRNRVVEVRIDRLRPCDQRPLSGCLIGRGHSGSDGGSSVQLRRGASCSGRWYEGFDLYH